MEDDIINESDTAKLVVLNSKGERVELEPGE